MTETIIQIIATIAVILGIIFFGAEINDRNKNTMRKHLLNGDIDWDAYESLYPKTK